MRCRLLLPLSLYRKCLSEHFIYLYCRLLGSDIVQLDMSVMALTLDQSAITSGEVAVESEFVFCDPLAQLD